MTELLFSKLFQKLSTRFSYDFLNLVEINNTLSYMNTCLKFGGKVRASLRLQNNLTCIFAEDAEAFHYHMDMNVLAL